VTANTTDSKYRSAASLRIAHKHLDPTVITNELKLIPMFAFAPGESKIHHHDSKSAGYWCGGFRAECPDGPDRVIRGIEELVSCHERFITSLIEMGCTIGVYIGIHLNVASIGFDLPNCKILNRLAIPIGIEFFGR